MPKAAKSTGRATKARSDPLSAKSGNSTKKPRSSSSKQSGNPSEKEPNSSTNTSGLENVNHDKADAIAANKSAANQESNYLLMVNLACSQDPMISRVLSVPPTITFAKFHEVLQIAFGWGNCHMHTFDVEVAGESGPHGHPIPHAVLTLQRMWGERNSPEISDIDPPQDESQWKLEDVFEKTEWDGKPLLGVTYTYDIGDDWDHQINFLGRADPRLHETVAGDKNVAFMCIAGEGHPCAEDCGGPDGWEDLKDAFKKRNGDKERKEWYKNVCGNGDSKGLDPYRWDIGKVNAELYKLKA